MTKFRMPVYIPGESPQERNFWSHVVGSDVSECWEWRGALNNKGYGKVSIDGAGLFAHRVAYELLIADIPDGLVIDHLCRNPPCVNPWHLDPVTQLVNNRRGETNAVKSHCPFGHIYDEANTYCYAGRRYCRACRVRHKADFVARRTAA